MHNVNAMTLKRIWLILVLVAAVFVPLVSAQNVSFSNLGQLGAEDILIYEYNGTAQTLYGQYNTSSPLVPLPENDFNIVIRPSAVGRFATPDLFLQDTFSWVETNALALIMILFLIGLLWKK